MGGNSERGSHPVSMRQRRILDVAERNPNASAAELASMVSTASVDLVEQILDEHGDPAVPDDEASTDAPTVGDDDTTADASDAMADGNGEPLDGDADSADDYPVVEELPEKHHRALAAIAARPEATQKEIADRLGVTRTTVSRWMGSIDGFDWDDREAFVDAVFDGPPSVDVTTDGGSSTDSQGSVDGETAITPSTTGDQELADLEERISALEAARDRTADAESTFEDPELVHKIVHACLNAETVSEDEELRILKELLA